MSRLSRADKVMLAVVALTLGVALVRFALVAATIPYAACVNARVSAEARDSGRPAPNTRILERVVRSDPFQSWWGGRRVPYRAGGDYLGVVTHHSTARALGCVIGVTVEQQRAAGVDVDRVILPSDPQVLYGEDAGTLMTRADGTEYRSYWAPPASDIAFFSDVAVDLGQYDPMVLPDQLTRIETQARLTEQTDEFFVAEPAAGASGTWVLLVREGDPREFLLVPLELSGLGGLQ